MTEKATKSWKEKVVLIADRKRWENLLEKERKNERKEKGRGKKS